MIHDPLEVFIKDFSEDSEIVFSWTANSSVQSLSVRAIFDNAFYDAALGETVLDTTSPRVTALATAVATLPREATVIIRGKLYSVTQIEPDGTGFATIMLAHE